LPRIFGSDARSGRSAIGQGLPPWSDQTGGSPAQRGKFYAGKRPTISRKSAHLPDDDERPGGVDLRDYHRLMLTHLGWMACIVFRCGGGKAL